MKLPQLSLRELLLLVVIAAMGCGWLWERRTPFELSKRNHTLEMSMQAAKDTGWIFAHGEGGGGETVIVLPPRWPMPTQPV